MKVSTLLLVFVLWQSTEAKAMEQIPKTVTNAEVASLSQESDLAQELADAQLFLLAQKSEINILNQHLKEAKSSEAKLRAESSTIAVGGFEMTKSQFIDLSLAVSGFLLLLVVILFWKMKRDSKSGSEAKVKLAELEEEYDQHIKTALEREQKIRRQLQDEINRRKISDAS